MTLWRVKFMAEGKGQNDNLHLVFCCDSHRRYDDVHFGKIGRDWRESVALKNAEIFERFETMFNRFAFRVFLAKDTGQVVGGSLAAAQGFFGGTSAKPKEKAKKKYTLKNGSQDANILNLLKAMRGAKGEKGKDTRDGDNYTLAELADMLPKSRGEGKVEPQSLKGRISQIVGWLRDKGIDNAKILAIMPSDYHSGQRGRRSTLTEASAEQAADFFADVPEVETDEDEGEEADAGM